MNVIYCNLHYIQFEELVVEFCVELLGNGVQGFVPGKDGGRDARFSGTAKLFPSDAAPWSGRIIIQAKHTELMNKSFSEADFSGESSVLSQEIPRIRGLFERHELTFYMLFANRRLTGVTEENIRRRIGRETGLNDDCIRLFDTSELDRLVKRYPEAVARAGLNPAKAPADIDPNDLAEVITRIAAYKLDELMEGSAPPPEQRESPDEKNRKKGLRDAYFNNHIRPKMIDFPTIRQFFSHPANQPYVKLYEDISSELEAKLDAWSDPDVPYERQLEVLIDRLFQRDFDLRKNKQLTRTVVYYMYCNCDIAKDAT